MVLAFDNAGTGDKYLRPPPAQDHALSDGDFF